MTFSIDLVANSFARAAFKTGYRLALSAATRTTNIPISLRMSSRSRPDGSRRAVASSFVASTSSSATSGSIPP